MWLINTTTLLLRSFSNDQLLTTDYAILSHVWGSAETTFQEHQALRGALLDSQDAHTSTVRSRVDKKIRRCCAFARREGYEWVWIDTCCIDKTSSAELSEAINSMFFWYAQARVCYAFLEDVDGDEDPHPDGSAFRASAWFTRGWTLQELLAPTMVVFLSEAWQPIGTRFSLARVIHDVTAIDVEVLKRQRSLDEVSVARRLSWAAHRITTRTEDRAYSLMGIFGVHMPTIYGEGSRAFIRLQEEILKHIPDQSIFAWGPIHDNYMDAIAASAQPPSQTPQHRGPSWLERPERLRGLLAPSPQDFADSADITPIHVSDLISRLGCSLQYPDHHFTGGGLRTQLPFTKFQRVLYDGRVTASSAILACRDDQNRLIILFLHVLSGKGPQESFVGLPVGTKHFRAARYPDRSVWKDIAVSSLFVRHGQPLVSSPIKVAQELRPTRFSFQLPQWTVARMRSYGYEYLPSDTSSPSNRGVALHIEDLVDSLGASPVEMSVKFDSTRSGGSSLTLTIGLGCGVQRSSTRTTIMDLWLQARRASADKTPPSPRTSSEALARCGQAHCHFADIGHGRAEARSSFDIIGPTTTTLVQVTLALTPWAGYQLDNSGDLYCREYAAEITLVERHTTNALSQFPTQVDGFPAGSDSLPPRIHGEPSSTVDRPSELLLQSSDRSENAPSNRPPPPIPPRPLPHPPIPTASLQRSASQYHPGAQYVAQYAAPQHPGPMRPLAHPAAMYPPSGPNWGPLPGIPAQYTGLWGAHHQGYGQPAPGAFYPMAPPSSVSSQSGYYTYAQSQPVGMQRHPSEQSAYDPVIPPYTAPNPAFLHARRVTDPIVHSDPGLYQSPIDNAFGGASGHIPVVPNMLPPPGSQA